MDRGPPPVASARAIVTANGRNGLLATTNALKSPPLRRRRVSDADGASYVFRGRYFDDTCRLEPIENPFTPKVLPMSS